ncbi:MAG: type II and III secretion system protein family protein [Planctomycetaceae bacterium]
MLAALTAQVPAQLEPAVEPPPIRANEQIFQVLTARSELQIVELFSRVFECPNRIVRVDGFDPDVVTVSALSPNRIRVRGEKAGVTTLVLTDEFDNAYSVEVFVAGDVRHLEAYLRKLFPEASVHAIKVNESIVLKGVVTEPEQITEIVDVAKEFAPNVLNQLRVGGVHQVLLDVRVMEVARTKIRQLGFNFLLNGNHTYVGSMPGNVVSLSNLQTPIGGPSTATFSGLTNSAIQFALMGSSEVFNGFVDALRNESLLKILAEPKLVTTSGRPATLLSGGEFPILVPQSLGTVSIEWREFGVRMEAVPVVLGNGRLRLDVAPEVSERDFSNAVTIQGMVVPGITTRRVNTQVEMRFGETLMIGGLISTRKSGETSKIPFLGELPLVGSAFRRVEYNQSETELLILVTPHMVAPLAPHQVPCVGPGGFTDDPTDRELYFDGMIEIPSYGPECSGCETGYGDGYGYGSGGGAWGPDGGAYGSGAYGSGAYAGGAYGAAGSGGAGCGSGCQNGDGCLPPVSAGNLITPSREAANPPSSSVPPTNPAPPASSPAVQAPAAPSAAVAPPVDQLPGLPPLAESGSGDVTLNTEARRSDSLGLINPFKSRVRWGEQPVEEVTKPIRLTSDVQSSDSQ